MFSGKQQFTQYSQVTAQIAETLVEAVGEDGPLFVVVDRGGNCWSNNTSKFTQVLSEEMIEKIIWRIDDGDDPVIGSNEECAFYATELLADQLSCGYLIVAVCEMKEVDMLENASLVEWIGSFANVVASLTRRHSFVTSSFSGEADADSDTESAVILN